MEWFPWICILLHGVWCFYMGYRAGRDDNDDLSEETQVELKKYCWDNPRDGKVKDQVKALLTDNARLQEAYDAMSDDLEHMARDRDKFRNLYVEIADKYYAKIKQEGHELPLTLEISKAENKEK